VHACGSGGLYGKPSETQSNIQKKKEQKINVHSIYRNKGSIYLHALYDLNDCGSRKSLSQARLSLKMASMSTIQAINY
jgi:hypothetical protein